MNNLSHSSGYQGGFVKRGKKYVNTPTYNKHYYSLNKSKWVDYKKKARQLVGLEQKEIRDARREQTNRDYARLWDTLRDKGSAGQITPEFVQAGYRWALSKDAFLKAQDIYSKTFLGKLEGIKKDALGMIDFYKEFKIRDIPGPWSTNDMASNKTKRSYKRTTDYGKNN